VQCISGLSFITLNEIQECFINYEKKFFWHEKKTPHLQKAICNKCKALVNETWGSIQSNFILLEPEPLKRMSLSVSPILDTSYERKQFH